MGSSMALTNLTLSNLALKRQSHCHSAFQALYRKGD